jgi:hypothetical protein
MSALDEVTVRAESGPVRLFNDCRSVVIAAVAVCIAVKAVVWLVSVVTSAFHAASGARSAAIPAATAAVTSMPGVVAPTDAARIELMLTAGVVVVVDPRSVLTADTELMDLYLCSISQALRAAWSQRVGSTILSRRQSRATHQEREEKTGGETRVGATSWFV